MDQVPNSYEVLGVAETVDVALIKNAWRGLVKQYHPDLPQNGDEEAAILRAVNAAWDSLRTEARRAEVDEMLARARGPRPSHRPPPYTMRVPGGAGGWAAAIAVGLYLLRRR